MGRRIRSVTSSAKRLRGPASTAWKTHVIGRRINSIWRRGKWIVFDLTSSEHLVFHLGMTGRLTVVRKETPVESHTHWRFALANGRQELRFRDVRRFGSVTYLKSPQALDRFFEERRLGPEPFSVPLAYWHQRLLSTKRCLKAVLLDQTVVAGVGNIYADESLFIARISPTRTGRQLTLEEAERLRRAIVEVLRRAITRRGATIRDYVGGSGREGEYQREFRVYGQTGAPCPRCGRRIECIRLAGRSTHFCRRCQPTRPQRKGQRLIGTEHEGSQQDQCRIEHSNAC